MERIIIDTDVELERDIAKKMVVEFIKSVAKSLHNSELVEFDVFSYTEGMDYLLGDICFTAFAAMEDHAGVSSRGKAYRFRPAYWSKEQNNESRIDYFLGETPLHSIEDEDVHKALDVLRDELS